MREIKFRAWNEIDKAMIDWSTIKVFESLLKNLMSGKVRHHQLMQYTGLKDKNSKEVYEGDIVRFVFEDGAIVQHKIEWSDKYHAWQVVNLSSGNSLTWNGSPLLWVAMKTYQPEVIGNIYQNSELLESQ